MEINRENAEKDLISFEFRLFSLSDVKIRDIKKELEVYPFSFEIIKIRKSDFFTILFEIENNFFDTELINKIIKKHNLNKENYGYWFSINSKYGHGGITVPEYVLKFYAETGGQLDFSYLISES